jgi:hypothetical protein
MTCPNDIHQTGTCHLCTNLAAGCFLRDIAPCIPSDLAPRDDDGTLMPETGLWELPRSLLSANHGLHHHRRPSSHPQSSTHCAELGIPFADLPMCQ